jgi:hypothetical protein
MVLKEWYAQPEDRFEVSVDGFVIDVVQGNLLVEIQTGNFASIKSKLIKLTGAHRVRLVYPIAQEKWIVKLAKDGSGGVSRRKSPKRGILEEVFWELVSFPQLLSSPNFSLEVLLIQEEEVRRYEGRRRWWRRGWVTEERRLGAIHDGGFGRGDWSGEKVGAEDGVLLAEDGCDQAGGATWQSQLICACCCLGYGGRSHR